MMWLAVIGVGVGSYVLRALPLWLGGRWFASPRVERTIAHAGTAALAALVAAGLRPDVEAGGSVAVATIAAAAASLVVAGRGASMLRVLAAGATAYAAVWALAALAG